MNSEERVTERVRTLITEMIEVRLARRKDVAVPARTLSRGLKQGNLSLKTLVKVTDSLGFDLVINVREKK